MIFFRSLALLLFCLSGMSHAATVRFEVSFSDGGTGQIDIGSNFVSSGGLVATNDAQSLFELFGTVFKVPLGGGSAYYNIDAAETSIASIAGTGPARWVIFRELGGRRQLYLETGSVPGDYQILSGGSVVASGTFSIADGYLYVPPPVDPQPAIAPIGASAWALSSALLGLVFLHRRRVVA